MQFEKIVEDALNYFSTSPLNAISSKDALIPEAAGLRIFDEPIFGCASASDPQFGGLIGLIGEGYTTPDFWVPGAVSVISFFLPFNEEIRRANAADKEHPVAEWLNGRIEGQEFLDSLGEHIKDHLIANGFDSAYPASDPRFGMLHKFASNWSERHTAYICGLGTFSASKGLITRKGVAGRYGSVITTALLTPTEHDYTSPFEYCNMCGKCAKNCPVNAIDMSRGVIDAKDHNLCSAFCNKTACYDENNGNKMHYGCGKCQVDVPCEFKIPPARKK